MKDRRIITLLGRRDEPTDAVEEYCRYLGEALRPHGYTLEDFDDPAERVQVPGVNHLAGRDREAKPSE